MDDNRELVRRRSHLLHKMEQIAAGLENGDTGSEKEARIIISRVALYASPEVLAQVFRGIIDEWDKDQSEIDKLLLPGAE